MQTANVMLALGGNRGHTVPKRAVTAAEIAVLRHIHGEDSVFDIQPTGSVTRSHREERVRLAQAYGRNVEGRFRAPAVDELFPGAAARVHENLNELDLPTDFYKPASRMSADDKGAHGGDGQSGNQDPANPGNAPAQAATPTGQPTPPSGAPQQPAGPQEGTVTDPSLPQTQPAPPAQQAASEPSDGIEDIADEHAKPATGSALDSL